VVESSCVIIIILLEPPLSRNILGQCPYSLIWTRTGLLKWTTGWGLALALASRWFGIGVASPSVV
jgi:hypothetical protein